MNNLVQNYKIIYEQLVKNCSHIKSFPQIRQPKYPRLDNVRFHHAKRLKPILERYKHKIELYKV